MDIDPAITQRRLALFFQIQLLSVSAGSSVSATGVYGPPGGSTQLGRLVGQRWNGGLLRCRCRPLH